MEKTLLAFLDFLQQEYHYSHNTIAAYRNDLNQFVSFLNSGSYSGFSHWSDVTDGVVNDYVDFMKTQSYASSSVARKVAAIKSFFNYLHARNLIKENPTVNIDSPRVKKRLPRTLSTEDIDRLLEAPTADSSPKHLRDIALLTLLYTTGMRVTEVVSLHEGDIDMEGRLLKCAGKDDQVRKLPLDDDTYSALENYLGQGRPFLIKDSSVKAIFLNHRGQQLTRQGLWLIIKAYAKQANLSTAVTPHTLRHSFAAHKLKAGSDLQEVQQLLGHANISTTQIYTQLAEKESKAT